MPTVYDLKPRFQQLLRPLVQRLVDGGFTANQVTLAGLALSAAGGALIWLTGAHWTTLLLLPVILFVRMALNAIDGMMAREHGQASRTGMFLNELTDVAADAALYLPLLVIADLSGVLVGLVVAGGALTEMAGVMGPLVGAERRYDGPFGKSDRAVFWGVLAVLVAVGLGGNWLNLVLAIAVGLSVLTTVNRCKRAMEQGDAGTA